MKELVRLGSADIHGEEPVGQALCHIRGVSYSFSSAVCNALNIDRQVKIGELSDEKLQEIDAIIRKPEGKLPSFLYNRKRDPDTGKDAHLIAVDLKLKQEFDVRLMKKLKTYKGMRHSIGQPVRGQRTKGHFRRGAAVGVTKRKEQPASTGKAPAKKEEKK